MVVFCKASGMSDSREAKRFLVLRRDRVLHDGSDGIST